MLPNRNQIKVNPFHHYYLTADGPGPRSHFLLMGIVVTGDGTNSGLVSVQKGIDSGGEVLLQVRVTANETQQLSFPSGIHMVEGLYLDLTTVDSVLVYGYLTNP